jgi:dTDP-4-dehydrorhamnose 3,5-epimerase
MQIDHLKIDGVKLIKPQRFQDSRGYFSETFKVQRLEDAGINIAFVQDNESMSRDIHTLRGLHYQRPPFAQSKLVRVITGRVLDVVIDARANSETFGQWLSVELTAERGEQIFVPQGCLHGFLTLEPDTIVSYKVDAYYNAPSDGGVRWNDPDLAIDWGLAPSITPILSAKDEAAQSWVDFTQTTCF